MKEGVFRTQVNTSWEIVRKLELDAERNWFPSYREITASMFRGLSYLDTWEICFRERYYDFQLHDNSLIQFRVEGYAPLSVSYAYYECPYQCLSYADFVHDYCGFGIYEAGGEFRPEYEDYVVMCNVKETATPIRYDHGTDSYREGVHPASHVHFGHMNSIRVRTKKVLRPLSFLLFVIRQFYSDAWRMLLDMSQAPVWCRNVRDNLEDVGAEFCNPLDEYEMALK